MEDLQKLLAQHPDEPAALFNLALDYGMVGNDTKALSLLQKMAEAHTGLDPKAPAGRPFKKLINTPGFASLIAQIEKENPPLIRSTSVFQIRERDPLPEGMAYDPIGNVFYISSISKHKILAVTPDGLTKDFKAPGQDGLGETFGTKVDVKRRILWVVSNSFSPGSKGNAEFHGLFQYDLKTGELYFKHLLPTWLERIPERCRAHVHWRRVYDQYWDGGNLPSLSHS
jgi:hypothetical protein